ncbi:MAG: glycosyltransferase family 4 protein [Methylocystis sp.]|nr:glycosyltransferase family 4 protein [Methylocystis sp.]MCA3585002.1 glycosyltransferase family 4 protein [Methylocystis sp.]MCA3586932.1 glycosyltransferase family 4 protein [Methylocystis sp.]MCA3592220.1 glycosyltransferase family 4 protein [Methylocystis sp.]
MARQLMGLLEGLCQEVRLVSTLRTHVSAPDPVRLAALRDASAAEADRILAEAVSGAFRPDLWFTYHPYHKSPDWIGPSVSARLGIPYVAAEASYAAARGCDAWADWLEASMPALRRAAAIFCFSERDRRGLEKAPGVCAKLYDLKPFLAAPAAPTGERARRPEGGPVRLLATAMMRPDNKRQSYLLLAQSLQHLVDLDWTLTIAGDGPARSDVEAAFARFPAGRVHFTGLTDRSAIAVLMREADILAWPGCREAYGMVYLEAAAAGLPAAAIGNAGVPEVVKDGVTGLLAAPAAKDGEAAVPYAALLRRLILDPAARRRLGAAAARFAATERTREGAEAILAAGLRHAMAAGRDLRA